MSIEVWLAFVIASVILLIIPGPTILTVISYSVSHGYKANVSMDVPEKHTDYSHIALEVTNLESVQGYLESINCEITEGPIVIPSGASFIIRDPDDNVIEFHKPAA